MKKLIYLLPIFLFACQNTNDVSYKAEANFKNNFFKIASDLPKPHVPEDNALTEEKIDLGRYLFYEKKLSINNKTSCGTCHIQSKAFTDGKKVAEGTLGHKHTKNSMSLTNVGYNSILTWGNENLSKLELQMLLAMFGESPPELAMSGHEEDLINRLKADPMYVEKFEKAFHTKNSITLENITKSIASFERTLVSFNSPYDKYMYNNDQNAISDSAKRGQKLFYSEKLECFHCHGGFNFSDSTRHEKSAFIEFNLHNTGLYNLNGKSQYPKGEQGFFEVSRNEKDIGKFKAPTLRNIELTAPYMHDGSINTLEEVVDHYAQGGRTITTGEFAGVGSKNYYKDGFVKGFKITPEEKTDLIEFLKSLTDQTFITDKNLSDPFESK